MIALIAPFMRCSICAAPEAWWIFYWRLAAHQQAVEEAQAHGRKPPAPPSNPVFESYLRSRAMWEKRLKGGEA